MHDADMTSMKIGSIEAGVGQPIVFLHGMAANAHSFHYQVTAFSERHRAIALDLPGYGESSTLPTTTFPTLAVWLRDALTQLEVDNPILVGHSYGGMIVQEYLASCDDPVCAVVLYATSPAFGNPDGEWQQKFIHARLAPLDAGNAMADLAPQIARTLVGPKVQPDGVARVQAGIADTKEETFRTTVHTLVTFEQRSNLSNITIPCLCVVGEEDSNASPSVVEKMATKIPDADFVCLPGLGHMAHVEDSYAFNAALTSFLSCVLPS